MDVALALVAAFFFALGLVLQEKAASDQPPESVGAGFLARLARQPVWLLGLAMQGVGFVAQAIALGIGRMVIVQPLLVATIVFALPLGRVIEKRPHQAHGHDRRRSRHRRARGAARRQQALGGQG